MTTVNPGIVPVWTFLSNNGTPLVGGQLFSFAAGTSTPAATTTDALGTTPNSNPIILNSRGDTANAQGASCGVYWPQGTAYKFILQDPLGNVIWSQDNLLPALTTYTIPVGTVTDAMLAPSSVIYAIDQTYMRTAAEIAAGVTPTNFGYDSTKGDIRRFGTFVIDGATDQTTNLTNLWTTLATFKGNVYIPYNTKFAKQTVYASVPANVTLVDDSIINSVDPPGYRLKHEPWLDDFGAKPNDATFDNTPALNAAATYCAAKGFNRIIVPGGNNTWYCNTKPTPFATGILLEGENPRSYLARNYTAGSSTEAFLQWTGSAGSGGDSVKGGGVHQLGIF